MTDDEKDRALCEAHCNSAADEYFNARPQLDSDVNRRIFYAGHRKAWIGCGEAVRLNAQAVPDEWEREIWRKKLENLISEYGGERATEAYHGGHFCKRNPTAIRKEISAMLSAAPAAPQPAQADQNEKRDAARWRYLAWHIGVAWNEQGFTSLVRIVSDKHREMLGDMVDRMMAGDWPEAAPQPAQQYDDEGDALTIAYLHGHGKGKDSVQPVLSEKDALLRQALEALEGFANITNESQGVAGFHLNGDTAEWDEFDEVEAASNTIEAIRTYLGVKND